MFKEFRDFAARGSVVDLAVGVIIGAAFGKIVTSLVNDIVMPPIGLLIGKVDFRNLYISLNDQVYPSLAEAQKAGAPTINYGLFVNTVLEFLIVWGWHLPALHGALRAVITGRSAPRPAFA